MIAARHPHGRDAMILLSVMILCLGAFVLWFMPLPRERNRRVASQIGGTALFGLGMCGLVLQLMVPVVA
ncbi:hypothetical protein J2X37_000151 [Croceicoccus sp. BE223]|nr:hypothetical protein [Croceicoccus sp. BE223]